MMPRPKTAAITHECLILCEGIDELNFLRYWLNSPDLADEKGFSRDIQVIDFGGNEDLPSALKAYRNIDAFEKVRYLLIIRDAELNTSGAVQSIQSALHNSGFMSPDSPAKWLYDSGNGIHLGFLLFPELSAQPVNGTLEDLCLQILASPDATKYMSRINPFLDALETDCGNFPHKHKTQLHTYFSVSGKFTGLKIGESARAGAFNWSHPKLDALKDFVRQMFIPLTEGESSCPAKN